MINRYEHNKLTWLDVINPTTEEIRELIEECGIPPEFSNDLTSMTPRTETLAKKGALKTTLDFPIVRRTDIDHPHEIKFLVTKSHLVTIRFEDIEAMHRFGKEFEVYCMLKQKKTAPSTITVFFTLLIYLYEAMETKLEYIETKLKDIENGIFDNREKEMVYDLSQIMRRLIDFRQVIGAHEKALENLHIQVGTAFPGKHTEAIIELEHRYRYVNRNVYALVSTTEDLRDTNNALLSTKQNEIMKMFTILAFITFPLTLFTSMFGMNTISTPIVGREGDFWLILGVMGIVSITFFAYFKYRRWF